MDSPQQARYRERLLGRRAESIAALGVKFDALARQGRMAEEDQAVLTHDEFVSVRLNRLEWNNLRRINSALARLDDGDYGICDHCGEPISPRRLEAIPWASLCVGCQEKQGEEQMDEERAGLEAVGHY